MHLRILNNTYNLLESNKELNTSLFLVISLASYPIYTVYITTTTGILRLVLNILYWSLVTLLIGILIRTRRTNLEHTSYSKKALILATTYSSAYILLGSILGGLGWSPYQFTTLSIVLDIVSIGVFVLGTELLRYYILVVLSSREKYGLGLALSAIFIALLTTPPWRFEGVGQVPLTTLNFVSEFSTKVSLGLIAGVIALIGGPKSSISFIATIEILQRLFPVLPNMTWYENFFVTVVLVVALYVVVSSTSNRRDMSIGRGTYLIIPLVIVTSMWFTQGFLGVYTFVIMSTSMTPTYSVGDIVVVVETNSIDVKIGDVIVFYGSDKMPIAHRVYDIIKVENKVIFITKGDALVDPDPEPVPSRNVIGVVKFRIPKIGWISIWIKELLWMIK